VINAAFGAGLITFIIACFAFYVRITQSDDFEVLRFAGACFVGLFFLTIMQIFFAFGHYNAWISLGLAWYCVYLLYDLKMIMTEKRYGLGMDDYIMGAIIIYIDIIVIFMRLLILLGKLKKR
jgi:FtsH-binding integral membrane protein